MDFDFNVILVPVTLILGVIWLLDIFWFKQHKRVKIGASKQLQSAEDTLQIKKKAFIEVLSQHEISSVTDDKSLDSITIDDAPVPVKQAEREYREAKRNVNIARGQQAEKTSNEHFLIRWAHDYFFVLAIVLVVRSFIIEPFNIPSSSMVPTLYTGDFVAVNKYAYGVRLPLTHNKVIDTGSPEHGDVAVFRFPENPKIYYIKRVIGLPGDTVSYQNGQLSINGEAIATRSVNFVAEEALTERLYTPVKNKGGEWVLSPENAKILAETEEKGARYYQEKLGHHTYLRRYLQPPLLKADYSQFFEDFISQDSKWQVTVPEGNYFVMGDNSDRSEDGRYWGFVPDANLAGKAVYVWMHKKPGLTNLPTFKYNRSID